MRTIQKGLMGLAGMVAVAALPALAEDSAKAAEEVERALHLQPNIDNGRQVYGTCAVCHMPEGWGTADGAYPQISGQLPSVIIKQLADIRGRNRDNPIMFPFAIPSTLGGLQNIADVAAYIARLPMNPDNTKGPGMDLEHGKKLYEDNCAECHGDRGQGDAENHVPLIQGQHFGYLVREFDWIRIGKRRNSDPKMVKQIQGFSPRDEMAVLDYVSRLPPPAEKLAQPGWFNPDFPAFVRPPGR